MTRTSLCVLTAIAFGSLTLAGFANGVKAKKSVLEARVPLSQGECLFSAEVVPIQFRLNTVRGKYKLVQVRVINRGNSTLRLSRTTDTAEVELGPQFVPAVIDLGARDPQLWNSLSAELRNQLVYPAAVEGGEEESLFLFVASTDDAAIPGRVRFKLASVPEPVVLTAPRAAAKK